MDIIKYFRRSLMDNFNLNNGLNSFGERLLFLRYKCAINRKEFCKISHMSYNSIKLWESTKIGKVRPDGAQKIVNAFQSLGVNCSMEWLLFGKGEPPFLIELTPPVPDSLLSEEDKIYKELNYFKTIHLNSVSMMIIDNSMVPFYEPGDLVAGIKKKPGYEDDFFINKCCIIENNDGVKLIRNVNSGDSKNTYNLSVLEENASYFPTFNNVTISYAAPIIWHRKKG